MRASVAVGAVFVGLGLGCAPSHRMVHDGNVYFERCYGADFDPHVTPGNREACWNAWLAHYTRHQPAHRIDYAMRRVESLQAGEPGLSLPGIEPTTGIPIEPAEEGLVTLHGPRAGAEVSTILDPSSHGDPTPNGCQGVCDQIESRCTSDCPPDNTACRKGCAHERAICLRGCY